MALVALFVAAVCHNHHCQGREERFERSDTSAPQVIGYPFVPITKAN